MTDIKKNMVTWDDKPKIDPKMVKWEDAQALRNPNSLDIDRLTYSPTIGMSGPERAVAAYGGAAPKLYQGVKNLLGMESDAEVKETKDLNAPLMATTGGKIGDVVGNAALAAPLAMAPGANTVGGSAAYGAGFGLMQPAGSASERVVNAATSGLLSGGVTKGANVLGKKVLGTIPQESDVPGLDAALTSGYKLTPTQAKQGVVPRMVEGLSGSAKLEKSASVKNQEVTNRLIREELGMPKDGRISVAELNAIRDRAGAAYEAVKTSVKSIKPDAKFRAEIEALRGDYSNASKEFPDLIKNADIENLIGGLNIDRASPASMVELTKKLRKDATSNLKSFDDPGKRELGMAQRHAADAIEELIDRALTSVGKDGLVSDWQAARRTIAKSYDVESALNDSTGNVSARQLGQMMKKGKPLSGGLEKAGSFARQFEGSARDVDKMRDVPGFSFADLLVGGAGVAGFDNLLGLGVLGARPATRAGLLSSPYQRTMIAPGIMAPQDQLLLDNVKRGALPLSLGGGLLAYPQQ
jgi:hypothetical protein